MKEQQRMKNKILKIFILIFVTLGLLIFKNNMAYAESSAYYIGSKSARKATEYQQATNTEEKNIEVTLDLSQTLDKMLYYILTYEEYEDKTYIGDANALKIEDKKQAAIYYFIHNYQQERDVFSKMTNNEKLKQILSNYTGSGNNLNELEKIDRNGAQIIYQLAEAWAKNENLEQAAKKLKINYKALSNEDIKYWSDITDEPLEGTIYNPNTEETTLIISIYIPKETEKTAQNTMKILDQAVVNEKVAMIKKLIDNTLPLGTPIEEEEESSLEDSLSDGEEISGTQSGLRI